MQERLISEKEWELISMLRNYRSGYPNTKFLSREISSLVVQLKKQGAV